jgi:F0F1-type ATP synthase assembly protein I
MMIIEVLKWARIVLSLTFLGVIIGYCAYYYLPQPFGYILGGAILLFGLVAGVFWAEKIWKKEKSDQFLHDLSDVEDGNDKVNDPSYNKFTNI